MLALGVPLPGVRTLGVLEVGVTAGGGGSGTVLDDSIGGGA